MSSEIFQILQEVMANVIIGLVIVALYYILNCLKGWQEKVKVQLEGVQDENFKRLLEGALERVEKLTGITVAGIEGRIGKTLREQVKEGKLDKVHLELLGKQAREQIISLLEPPYEAILRDSTGDLEAYIDNLIEAKLEEIKVNRVTKERMQGYGY